MNKEKFEKLITELQQVKKEYFTSGVSLRGTIFTYENKSNIDYAVAVFTNLSPFDDYNDKTHWFPTLINECNTVDDVIATLRKDHYYVMKFTHKEWNAYKKERKLTNATIAKMLGMSIDSVKTMTQPGRDLPKWAIAMLYEWKN